MKPELSKFSVKGLFGYLTYELNDLNAESSIFIIGNNGSGKSTIFRLISALIESRWHTFHEVVFEELSFVFQKGEKEYSYNFRKRESVEWQTKDGEWRSLVQGSWREFNELEGTRQQAEWIYRNSSEVGKARCGRHWTTPERSHVGDSELVRYWKEMNSNNISNEQLDFDETSHPDLEALKPLGIQFVQANRLLELHEDQEVRPGKRIYREERRNPPRAPIYQISDLLRDKIRSQITGAFIKRDTIGNEALNTWLSLGDITESEKLRSVHQLAQDIEKIESAFSEFSQNA